MRISQSERRARLGRRWILRNGRRAFLYIVDYFITWIPHGIPVAANCMTHILMST